MNLFLVVLLCKVVLNGIIVYATEETLSLEIKDVATGLNNTEFAYFSHKIEEDFIFLKKFRLDIDESKTHHVVLMSCSDTSNVGQVVYE